MGAASSEPVIEKEEEPQPAKPPEKAEVTVKHQAAAFTVFALTNVGLNYFNKWALSESPVGVPGLQKGGFDFPFFYTMFHMLASCVSSLLLMLTCTKPPPGGLPSFGQLWEYKYLLVPLGVLTTLNNGLNNSSLVYVALFVNQSIKATAPLPTSFFEFLLQRKVYSLAIYFSIACIVAGCVLANYSSFTEGDDTQTEQIGVIFCLISLLASTLGPVIKKIAMSGGNSASGDKPPLPPLTPQQCLFWDTGIAFWAMFIIWIVGSEREPSIEYLEGDTANPNSGWLALGIIVFGMTMAFAFNLSVYYFIMYTSALSSTVGSIAVKIFMLLTSAAFDPDSNITGVLDWAGVAVVITSILAYNYFSYQFKQEEHALLKSAQTGRPDENTPLSKA